MSVNVTYMKAGRRDDPEWIDEIFADGEIVEFWREGGNKHAVQLRVGDRRFEFRTHPSPPRGPGLELRSVTSLHPVDRPFSLDGREPTDDNQPQEGSLHVEAMSKDYYWGAFYVTDRHLGIRKTTEIGVSAQSGRKQRELRLYEVKGD